MLKNLNEELRVNPGHRSIPLNLPDIRLFASNRYVLYILVSKLCVFSFSYLGNNVTTNSSKLISFLSPTIPELTYFLLNNW